MRAQLRCMFFDGNWLIILSNQNVHTRPQNDTNPLMANRVQLAWNWYSENRWKFWHLLNNIFNSLPLLFPSHIDRLVCLPHFARMRPMENCAQFILLLFFFVIAINPWNDTIDYRYVQLELANTFTIFLLLVLFLLLLSHLTVYPMITGHIPNWK